MVSVRLVVCSLSVFLSMCLVCFVCVMLDCVGEMNVLSLKVMVVFLLANPCIVFQRVCVLCL